MVWVNADGKSYSLSFDAFARLFRDGPNQPSPSRPTECAYRGRAEIVRCVGDLVPRHQRYDIITPMRRHGQPAGDVASKFLRRYVLFLFDAMCTYQ